MRYACEVVGFMQVIGHGVSEELQEKHLQFHKRFFQLPREVKERLILNEASDDLHTCMHAYTLTLCIFIVIVTIR